MKPLHLEGMGLPGSVLAWHIWQLDVPFTWSDIDAEFSAWPASTGMIYPSGDPEEQRAYDLWLEWSRPGISPMFGNNQPWLAVIPDAIERAAFWFLSKDPPHGGRYKIAGRAGPLSLAAVPTVHVNVQHLVTHSRAFFGEARRESAPAGARLIVAHGFSPIRLHHVNWGWSALVQLRLAPELLVNGLRPALYLRTNRFTLRYALPRPGTDLYYAGSSSIQQRSAKHRDPAADYTAWEVALPSLTGGLAHVEQFCWLRQGWRPAAAVDDHHVRLLSDGTLIFPPLRGSGVRYAPNVALQALSLLGLA